VCENYFVIPKIKKNKMAIYHCSFSVGSRSSGSSSVASAAYREGEKIEDKRTGIVHDYSRKSDVIESMILAPKDALEFCKNSSDLWNEVERTEKRKDSQLFREVTLALPREQNHEQNKNCVEDYCTRNFTDQGMVAHLSYHASKNENPHVHIMLTMRELNKNGFGQKNRSWNSKENLNNWREDWANTVNKHLEKNKIDQSIDHRSLEDQGLDRTPQIHVGSSAMEMEKRGVTSDRGALNRDIIAKNLNLIKENVQQTITEGIDHFKQRFEAYKQTQVDNKMKAEQELRVKQHQKWTERQEHQRQEGPDIGFTR
jgi:ATP-dependent exoDNAse (exonuclease V) alpha subunit